MAVHLLQTIPLGQSQSSPSLHGQLSIANEITLSGNLYKLNITGATSGVTSPRPGIGKDLIAAVVLDGAGGKSGPGI